MRNFAKFRLFWWHFKKICPKSSKHSSYTWKPKLLRISPSKFFQSAVCICFCLTHIFAKLFAKTYIFAKISGHQNIFTKRSLCFACCWQIFVYLLCSFLENANMIFAKTKFFVSTLGSLGLTLTLPASRYGVRNRGFPTSSSPLRRMLLLQKQKKKGNDQNSVNRTLSLFCWELNRFGAETEREETTF